MAEGKGIHVRYAPGTFRPLANRDNDYLIDRRAQKEELSFSGVEGIAAQDFSLQESMGPIQNHAAEHLVPTDKAIAMARRILYGAARNADSRFEPAGLDAASQRVRAGAVLLDRQVSISAWCSENLFKGMEAEVWSL